MTDSPSDCLHAPAASDAGEVTNTALLAACRSGSRASWQTIVARYERLVFGVARREGLAVEDAHDVTQSVFEQLFDSLERIEHPEQVAWWLMTVTRRTAWRVRSRERREAASTTTDDDPLLDDTAVAGPESETVRTIWLYESMLRLPEPCRQLLHHLYFDPTMPSYADVAIRLGRPVGSIGPTRARCLERLRTLLEDGPS